MKLTIFSRLVFGYLIIFILVVFANSYVIYQLRQFNTWTYSILRVDNRILDIHKKLTDTLLSQIEYEKKFIIMSDQALLKNFLVARDEFTTHLGTIHSLVDSDKDNHLLRRIKILHNEYLAFFDEEVNLLKANKQYQHTEFKKEKEKILDEVTVMLRQLKDNTQFNTYKRIKNIADSGEKSRDLAMVIIATSLILGMAISVVITHSITRPLSIVKSKIRKIAKGDFEKNAQVSSPPEMKELAEALNSMSARLKEVDKMKSDFFSLMSHELRTPLTSIKEGTNLLCEQFGGEISEKQQRILSIISEESNRLIELVNSLLDISKIEAGMMMYHFTTADFAPFIHSAIKGIMPLSIAKHISIKKDIGELPLVKVDTEKILQVLRNLIGNAVKFTPEGGLVTVSANSVEAGVKVSVTDSGPGIDSKYLATIFDKFSQATLTKSNKLKGSGIGLAIVKHIIKDHGGTVWAESEIGHGSTFTFVLPL
jgi:two-component system sensor histidine kinase GlrK